jgi:chromosome segregation ATPase
VNEFYDKQEQQTMLVNVKSQLLQLEKENNKLRHTVEDLSDEKDNLSARIAQIESELEAIRKENVEEAKEIEYDSEQRKIMESYESLLKSKDITIKSMEERLVKTEQRIKKRMNLKSVHLDEGVVLLKNKQTLLVKEIIKNVEDSLVKSTTDSNINLPVGKISITNILYHLNQNLFSE